MWKASLMRYETTLVVRFKRQHLYKFSCYRPIGYMCKSYGWLVCYSGKWLGELCTVCQMVGLVHAVNVKKNGREKCFVDLSQAVAITVDVSVWWSRFENCQFLFWVKDVHHITFNFICDSSCFFWKNGISLQDFLLIRKCISCPVLVLPPLLEWLCYKYHWSLLLDGKKLHYVTFWGEDQYVHNAWCPVLYPGICYVFIDGIFSRKRIIVKVYQIMLNSMKLCTIV